MTKHWLNGLTPPSAQSLARIAWLQSLADGGISLGRLEAVDWAGPFPIYREGASPDDFRKAMEEARNRSPYLDIPTGAAV